LITIIRLQANRDRGWFVLECLTRRQGEEVVVGDLRLRIVAIQGNEVLLGYQPKENLPVRRAEDVLRVAGLAPRVRREMLSEMHFG
jgi:sRNA-binding carbon storage regulator CsrA